jgi:hypothetical protein
MGSTIGSHRNITDTGVGTNMNAPALSGVFGVLPDITLVTATAPAPAPGLAALSINMSTTPTGSDNNTDLSLASFQSDVTQYTLATPSSALNPHVTATLPAGSDADITLRYRLTGKMIEVPLESGVGASMFAAATNPGNNKFFDFEIVVTPKDDEAEPTTYTFRWGIGSNPQLDSTTTTGVTNPLFGTTTNTLSVWLAETGENAMPQNPVTFSSNAIAVNLDAAIVGPNDKLKIFLQPTFTQARMEEEPCYVQLENGEATKEVYIIAQDGTRALAKTITFKVLPLEGSGKTRLATFGYEPNGSPLSPGSDVRFVSLEPDVFEYDIALPVDTAFNAKVAVYYSRVGVTGSTTSTQTLSNGVRTYTVTPPSAVTGGSSYTYTFNFKVEGVDKLDATWLNAVSYQIGDGQATSIKGLNTTDAAYEVALDESVEDGTTIALTYTPVNKAATIKSATEAVVTDGAAVAIVTVLAADGQTEQTYSFRFAKDVVTLELSGLAYKIGDGSAQSVRTVLDEIDTYYIALPYGTAPDATVTLIPTFANENIVAGGDLEVTLTEGAATADFSLSVPKDGGGFTTRAFSAVFSIEGETSIYEYLPIGSQYTNGGFGIAPAGTIYQQGNTLTAPDKNYAMGSSTGNFGGYLTQKFTQPIKNDPANPYGVDFIIYGNGQGTRDYAEPAAVWVAQDKDRDGEPDEWYALAGSLHFDNTTSWNSDISYSLAADGSTNYQALGGTLSGNLRSYTYPQNNIYGKFGSYVSSSTALTAIRLDSSKRAPAFGYADVHPNDAGPIEEPLNPYRDGPLFGDSFVSNFDEIYHGRSRGDSMDISWAVDAQGNPVSLDEISFVKSVTASFVDGGSIGERSAEIYKIVPLRANVGQQAVGRTSNLTSFVLSDGDDAYSFELEADTYEYTITVPDLATYSIDTDDAANSLNVYINDSRNPEGGYSLAGAKTVDEDTKMLRVIAQEGEKEPVIYTLTLVVDTEPPEPEPVLTGIAITTPPTRTEYEVGDTFDPAGLVVTASYDASISKPILSERYTTSLAASPVLAQAGDITVTVSYTEGDVTVTATFVLVVNEAPSPSNPNVADVAAAKAAIEGANSLKSVAQSGANNAAAIRAWLEQELAELELSGVSYAVSVNAASAVAGSINDTDGTNGAYTVSVALGKGAGEARVTDSLSFSGVIIATAWTPPAGTIAVTISVESFSFNDDYIVEPTLVTLPTDTLASVALDALLKDKEVDYRYDNTLTEKFYLSGVALAGLDDGYLDAFDKGLGSGWMLTVNNSFPNVGAAEIKLVNGDVVRWQYTSTGYGADIGGSSSGGLSTLPDKDALTEKVARINAADRQSAYGLAYTEALDVLRDLDATLEEVSDALAALLAIDGGTVTPPDDPELPPIPDTPVLAAISVSAEPVKTSYTLGDTLDLTGLVITASYNNGDSEQIAGDGYTTEPANGSELSVAGTQQVMVSYTRDGVTKTTAFTITVVDPNSGGTVSLPTTGDVKTALARVASKENGTIDGSLLGYKTEWVVLGLARSGNLAGEDRSAYLTNLAEHVKEVDGKLSHSNNSNYTEYSRVVLALTALGVDASDFASYDLVAPLSERDNVTQQGINGPVFALLALDSGGYGSEADRAYYRDWIISHQLEGGGWNLEGKAEAGPDVDITAMTLQALAPYYGEGDVALDAAVEAGLLALSALQQPDGGFA